MPYTLQEEIQHVLLGQQINYQGIFSSRELFKLIDDFFRKYGYEKKVLGDKETVTPSGKNINVRIRPFRKVKDNALEIQVWINITGMTDVVREVDGFKVQMNRGKINIILDSFVIFNFRGKWESRAEYFMIRQIFDKFLFVSAERDYEGMVKAHQVELKNELNAFLNLNKFLY